MNPDELMKMDFSRCLVFNQGMPPYKGKKVVYYEDPRFKDKAFGKVLEMNEIYARLKKLPSHHKKHFNVDSSIQRTIERIEKIEVTQSIPSDFDIFADDGRETKF